MKVLIVTASEEDYMADPLIHGLRTTIGTDAIDYPKCDPLYSDFPEESRVRLRGHGFTLYTGLLPSIEVDRFHIRERIASGEFQLTIFANIWRTYGLFLQWRQWLSPKNCILLDSEDTPQVYPHAGLWWRRPYGWTLPPATNGFLYFKREWTEDTRFNFWHRLLPRGLRRALPHYKGLRTISFSIPAEKIVKSVPSKSKIFSRHIVDPEVAANVAGSSTSYAFSSEAEYYADLQSSRFGITTKRAGWDCLRHYEIAANGSVPCFRDLDRKPKTCAPHGLIPGVNSISYRDAEELLGIVRTLPDEKYSQLAVGALQWARVNSTSQMAKQIIDTWKESLR